MNSDKKKYDLSHFKILIAEDFEFIRTLLTMSLKEMGVGKVIMAESGLQAKEILADHNATVSSNNIDVVILDWLMPKMGGDSLLRWIRSHKSEAIKFIPTIACTAYASEDIVQIARDKGCNEVMVKPVSAEKVARRIQYVIDKPRPFLQCPDYFGPDRRRKDEKFSGPEKRKTKAEEITKHVEELD